jgi:hypothetical protein
VLPPWEHTSPSAPVRGILGGSVFAYRQRWRQAPVISFLIQVLLDEAVVLHYTFYLGDELVAKLELPNDPKLASKFVDSHVKREERALEMGRIGVLFGNIQEKTGNIAGVAVFGSLLSISYYFL